MKYCFEWVLDQVQQQLWLLRQTVERQYLKHRSLRHKLRLVVKMEFWWGNCQMTWSSMKLNPWSSQNLDNSITQSSSWCFGIKIWLRFCSCWLSIGRWGLRSFCLFFERVSFLELFNIYNYIICLSKDYLLKNNIKLNIQSNFWMYDIFTLFDRI